MPDTSVLLQLGAVGACAGLLAGLMGIGGGMLIVPCLTWILARQGMGGALAVKMAIATSMATIFFSALSSVLAHHRKGAVRWDLVRGLTPGIILGGALASAGVFALADGLWLALLFAGFVAFSATQMLADRKPAPGRRMPGWRGQVAMGGGIGLLSGLVGAGGGFVSVPLMVWCNVAIHSAVATSAALGFPVAASNVAGYIWSGAQAQGLPPGSLGYLWLPGLAVLAVCSVTLAPLGARWAHRLPVRQLRRAFALVLYLLAASMLARGLSA